MAYKHSINAMKKITFNFYDAPCSILYPVCYILFKG